MTMNMKQIRAVVTVVGHDTVGIIASVSEILKRNKINILDISQSVLGDYFAMVMLIDITSVYAQDTAVSFNEIVNKLDECGKGMGLKIHTMHEEIFNTMHEI